MIEILQGNCLDRLKDLKDQSINTCITSPPYWGLRDYGEGEQLGLEDTPEEFVENLVNVFREVKRVLHDSGTVWLNLGDSYYNYRPGKGQSLIKQTVSNTNQDLPQEVARRANKIDGLKEKDLVGIPWRVAFALQADGWYLRQDIIWHKPNPMPESVQDRCTKSHEYIFLLSKNAKYYFDNEAIKIPVKNDWGTRDRTNGKYHNEGSGLAPHSGLEKSYETANKRSVWTITTKPYSEAHFATYPPDLIEPCVLAGCPEKFCVECGTPYLLEKEVERKLTIEEVKKIKADIAETNKTKKPYAVLEKEFRNQVIEYRNLPNHDEIREYLKEYKSKSGLTIDAIEERFGTQAPHHWFEKGGSYPSKEDWIVLKEIISLDDTYDKEMTEVFYKSGLKCGNKYVNKGLKKQCQCKTDETKPGTVLDPFAGSGTTGLVAKQHNRNAVLIELNEEYIEIAKQRINPPQTDFFFDERLVDK